MAGITMMELQKMLQGGQLHQLYYLYGKDIAAVNQATAKLLRHFDADGMAVQKFEGKTLDLNLLTDAVVQYPMLSEYNVIYINDPDGEDWTADQLSGFLSALEQRSAPTVVICNITGFDVCGGKKTPTAKNKKIIDFFSKNGIVAIAEARTAAQLAKPIMDKVARRNCTIAKPNAERLAELCLCNTVLLGNEIDKLCAYANGSEITAETIRLLVARQLDINAFALARAVVSQNGNAAMQALSDLTAERAEPIVLLSVITGAFTDLYRAKAAQAAGKHQDHLTQDFSYRGREFAVRNALRDCAKTSIEQLRDCICILRDTDSSLKSSRMDGRTQIEIAISRMLLAVQRR